MKMYNAYVEVDTKDTSEARTDDVLEALAAFHVAVSAGPRGHLAARISLAAENLAQATAAALALVEQATGAGAVVAEVMTEEEFDAREGFEPTPELVSVTEAAELLGITRQAVLDRIRRHTLPANKVGRDYAIPRSAVRVGGKAYSGSTGAEE